MRIIADFTMPAAKLRDGGPTPLAREASPARAGRLNRAGTRRMLRQATRHRSCRSPRRGEAGAMQVLYFTRLREKRGASGFEARRGAAP